MWAACGSGRGSRPARCIRASPLTVRCSSTSSTSRGGCTYHIAHPGGRAYDEPPVNAVEAESRRARRFEATGFTPGKLELSDVREMQARISTDIGAPGILDLRRVRTVLR